MSSLSRTWKTDGDTIGELSRWLFHHVRGKTAIVFYGGKAWVVRYTDPFDEYETDPIKGHRREVEPWRRKSEILSVGNTPDEAVWWLKPKRSMSGGGVSNRGKIDAPAVAVPIHDDHGEWIGFYLPDGTRIRREMMLPA